MKADLSIRSRCRRGRQLITTTTRSRRLISEHGLRIGVEADQILITGATRYGLAAQAVAVPAALPGLANGGATVADRLLKLDAECAVIWSIALVLPRIRRSPELQAVKPGRGGRPTAAVRGDPDDRPRRTARLDR